MWYVGNEKKSNFSVIDWIFLLFEAAIAGAILAQNDRARILVQVKIYIVGFWLVEMAISTNQKPTIYRNLYKNTGPE